MPIPAYCMPTPEQELGLALMVSLAFPDRKDDALFLGNALADLCHQYLLIKWESDPQAAHLPQLMKPIYAFRDQKRLEKNLKNFDRRIQERLHAAKMAIAFLQEAHTEARPARLPKSIGRISLAQLSGLISLDVQNNDQANIHKRIWQPSLPVIHLAAALAVYMNSLAPASLTPMHLFELIERPGFRATLIDFSNDYAALLITSKQLHLDEDQLMRFSI